MTYFKPENQKDDQTAGAVERLQGFFLLISSDLKIISVNNTDEINIPDLIPGSNLIESLSKINIEKNKETINEIESAFYHVLKHKKTVLLKQKQFFFYQNNLENHSSLNINFIPLFNKEIVENVLIYLNPVSKRDVSESLEKVYSLQKKLFSVAKKDYSFDTTLDYIIKIIEENNPELLCSIIIPENGKLHQKASANLPLQFFDEINEMVMEIVKDRKKIDQINTEEKCINLNNIANKYNLQNYNCYILRGKDNSFLGMLNVFYKKDGYLTSKEQKILQIVVEFAVIIIERENFIQSNIINSEILNEISNALPVVILQFIRETNGKYKFTYLTENIKSFYDFSSEEIYNNPEKLLKKVHPDDFDGLMNSIEKSAQSLQAWDYSFRVISRNSNEYIWLKGNAVPEKKQTHIVWNGSLIDITEIREAIEKITASETRYHLLFEKNPLALMVIEKESLKLLDVNSKAINTFGYTEKDLLHLSLKNILPKDDLKKLQDELKNLQPGKDIMLNLKNIKKNGKLIDVEFLITEFQFQGTDAYLKIVTDVTAKLKSEDIIERQNLLFKELFNASPFGIVLFDDMERIIEVNNSFEKIFQFNFEELKNRLTKDFIVPTEKQHESDEIFEAAKKLEAVQLETYRKRKDGQILDMLIVYYPIKSNDLLLGFYGIYVDISKQKEAERILKKEKNFTDSMINSLPGILYVISVFEKGLRLTLWNENLRKISGYTDQEIIDLKVDALFKGNDLIKIREQLDMVLTSGKAEAEAVIVSKSGKETLYYFTGILSKISNQKYIIGMGLDITDRSKNQQMLVILKRGLESVAEGVIIVNNTIPDKAIMYVNPEFCRITGYSQEEVEGKNIFLLSGPKTKKRMIGQMKDAIQYERTFRGEVLSYRKDGSTFWNLLILTPVFGENKAATHFVATITDITDIKNWQQRLEEYNMNLIKANQELDRFVYSTSHDLRAPLTSVLGLINIALAETDPELLREFLERMRNSVLKLDSFIQDIVNYSRNSRLEVLRNEVDFNKILHEIIEKLEFMEGTKSINFKIDIQDSQKFYSDKNRLIVILSNLVSNAIKYQDSKKDYRYIYIQVKTLRDKISIEIEDNGTGIPRAYQKKVFEMFFRASEQSTGSGLGLYIVKEMVDKLKGKIKMESSLGVGTKFFIEIPNLKE
ncbi:MAG: PAS domain S-box protein [Bacteroidetes bacterium]|nr:PAS domain S-box protein [Bacteroidota bacterium]HET6243411.1 PAS domain S-box protein [Bacteroidia bacterium]